MNFRCRGLAFTILSFFLFSSFYFKKTLEKISMSVSTRTLEKGKVINVKGDMYYSVYGGLMVTHITFPVEYVMITNSKGELKIYNIKENNVVQGQSAGSSSENSFLYYFLSGKIQDMGLKNMGFQLKGSKIDENRVITKWLPNIENFSKIGSAELVHEDYFPIYLAYLDVKKKPLQKIYYYNYQKTAELSIPLTITEIVYIGKKDSIITKRTYSDIKTNEQVDDTWFHFKIPANASIVKQ